MRYRHGIVKHLVSNEDELSPAKLALGKCYAMIIKNLLIHDRKHEPKNKYDMYVSKHNLLFENCGPTSIFLNIFYIF